MPNAFADFDTNLNLTLWRLLAVIDTQETGNLQIS